MDLGHLCTFEGTYEMALDYERTASETYHDVGDLHGVAWTQMSIGWAAFALGDLTLAETSFQTSLKLHADSDVYCSSHALVGLAEIMRRRDDLARAGVLFGAAARFSEQETVDFVPFRKFGVVDTARGLLGNPLFAEAWAEGEAMALEQAIAIALE
jgi:hypothetical protein